MTMDSLQDQRKNKSIGAFKSLTIKIHFLIAMTKI